MRSQETEKIQVGRMPRAISPLLSAHLNPGRWRNVLSGQCTPGGRKQQAEKDGHYLCRHRTQLDRLEFSKHNTNTLTRHHEIYWRRQGELGVSQQGQWPMSIFLWGQRQVRHPETPQAPMQQSSHHAEVGIRSRSCDCRDRELAQLTWFTPLLVDIPCNRESSSAAEAEIWEQLKDAQEAQEEFQGYIDEWNLKWAWCKHCIFYLGLSKVATRSRSTGNVGKWMADRM